VEIFLAKIFELSNSEREAKFLSSIESVNATRVVQGSGSNWASMGTRDLRRAETRPVLSLPVASLLIYTFCLFRRYFSN
jgi:hypothetical protein